MIIDIEQIRNLLPHGDDFIMVDSVEVLSENTAVGTKLVREDEHWVAHHFPGKPMFPGFYMLEALGQTAAVMLAEKKRIEHEEKIGRKVTKQDSIENFKGLTSVEFVKFRHPIYIGDTMKIFIEITKGNNRWPLWTMQGKIKVGEETCCSGTVTGAWAKTEQELNKN